jgi:glutaredoxin
MKHLLNIILCAMFLIFNLQVFAAVNIVECEDAHGDRSFHKTCPPDTTLVGSKKINTGTTANKLEDTQTDIKVTLYAIPECESCEEVREFLNSKNISFNEKNVSDNIDLQKELLEIANELRVPTTVIGEKVITGYNRSELIATLEAAGYQENETEKEPETETE